MTSDEQRRAESHSSHALLSEGQTPVHVVVAGSLNVDFTARVQQLPKPGATVLALEEFRSWGGKGANQALAAARQGGQVSLIGAVGADEMGGEYLEALRKSGVDVEGVAILHGEATGRAWIVVDSGGENSIVVLPGANGRLAASHVACNTNAWARADLVIVQWETTREAAMAATRSAWERATPVLWNPSPWQDGLPWGTGFVDFVVVNEGEAEALLEVGLPAELRDCDGVLDRLNSLQIGWLIVTRGAGATWVFSLRETFECAAFPVTPVDTVGAGDAFAGALAVQLARGRRMRDAVEYANAAGALATLARGAQTALPDEVATWEMLRRARWNQGLDLRAPGSSREL